MVLIQEYLNGSGNRRVSRETDYILMGIQCFTLKRVDYLINDFEVIDYSFGEIMSVRSYIDRINFI